MTGSHWITALGVLLVALGMWRLLPRGAPGGRFSGAVLALAGVGLWASQLPGLASWVNGAVFYVLAGVTVVAAACAVSFRSAVYCALWFGLAVLGTAGLMLWIGAQFLAVATVVVYAGAILVMFLFVLMLSHPEGRAAYDRRSWEALLAAATGAVIVGFMSMTVGCVCTAGPRPWLHAAPSSEQLAAGVLHPEHVACFGAELFGRQLLAVLVAGVLLLAALVGAAVMVAWRAPPHGTGEDARAGPLGASGRAEKPRGDALA